MLFLKESGDIAILHGVPAGIKGTDIINKSNKLMKKAITGTFLDSEGYSPVPPASFH